MASWAAWASRAQGTETHGWSCGARSSRGAARQGRCSNFATITRGASGPCKLLAAMRAPQRGGIAPRFCRRDCHRAWALSRWAAAWGADSRKGFSAHPSLPQGVLQVEAGTGGSTGMLLHAQHDGCPARGRTDMRRLRHLAFPFVELAKRDSCQAWDSPSHSAKVQRYFKTLPLLQPQLLLRPLDQPAGQGGSSPSRSCSASWKEDPRGRVKSITTKFTDPLLTSVSNLNN